MNVPSGYTALDLIGFTDRGNYDSTANYVKNDLVHHNNSIWKCLVDDTTAVTPAEGANWTVYIQNGTTLNGMADVNLTTPANGDLLRYNSTSSKWENQDVDSTPTQSSIKLVQSGGVYTQLANKANTADLATVATSGAYSDLSGAPQLAAVATSGAYSDLTGQPTIPTVNDATLTIQKNGTNVETFTANSSTNKTANITVPDVINDLSDVNISSVANEEILAYDSTSSKWKNSGALGALKETLTNQINKNDAKNLLVTTYEGFRRYNTAGTWSGDAYALNGVTFTLVKDENGYITGINVNGTASALTFFAYPPFGTMNLKSGDYKINGNPTGYGTNTAYLQVTLNAGGGGVANIGNEYSLSYDSTSAWKGYCLSIRVDSGGAPSNKLFTPMVRLASDSEPTFAPYAKTNQQLTKDDIGLTENEFVNGAVNLLPNELVTQVITSNGANLNVTVNGGVVTLNGTTGTGIIALKVCDIVSNSQIKLSTLFGKRVKMSGCPAGGSHPTYYLNFYRNKRGVSNDDYGNGKTFDVENDGEAWVSVSIILAAGQTLSNLVFKPMITLADMPNSDYNHYVPYAKSNKELTEAVADIGKTNVGAWSLGGASAPTTETEETTVQSRSMDIFEFICFTVFAGTRGNLASQLVPLSAFKARPAWVYFYDTSNAIQTLKVEYVSSTKFKVTASTSGYYYLITGLGGIYSPF